MRGKKSKQYRALAKTLCKSFQVPELERIIRQRLKRHAHKEGLDAAVVNVLRGVAQYSAQRNLANALERSSPAARHSGRGDEGVVLRTGGGGQVGVAEHCCLVQCGGFVECELGVVRAIKIE